MAEMKRVLCQNPRCVRGADGGPASFIPARAWSKFCCTACRMQEAAARDKRELERLRRLEGE